MTASELLWLNAYFNNNSRTCWTYANWFDLCPMGEARFINNSLNSPNDLTLSTTLWAKTGVTAAISTLVANPLDGRFNVTQASETNTGSAAQHLFTQSLGTALVPSQTHTFSAYFRPIGGRNVQLATNDGTGNGYYMNFNLTALTATIGVLSGTVVGTIQQLSGGWYLCSITFTTSASAIVSGSSSTVTILSGTSDTYIGDSTKGGHIYGCVLQQTSNLTDRANLLPWVQAGEPEIDAFYTAWRNAPYSANSPTKIGYSITNNGIQLIGSTWNNGYLLTPSGITTTTSGMAGVLANPVYIYYRVAPFSYFGAAWTAILTYAIGDIVQFTNATSGVINYYTCLAATTAGQSPVTNPSSWQLNWIPDILFQYCVYKGYADWLRTDGQFDKANAQEGLAQTILENEFDTQEREMGMSAPLRVQTHLTSR